MIETTGSLHSAEPVKIGAYTLRPATFDDIDAFLEISREGDIEASGTSQRTREMVEGDWNDPDFDIGADIRLVTARDGALVGYIIHTAHPTLPVRPWSGGYVRPAHRNQGIGTAMMRWVIERAKRNFAKVPDDARVVLQNDVPDTDAAAVQLLKAMGFERTRSSYTMRIDMESPPAAPVWPEGKSLTTLAETPDLARFVTTSRAGFRDHRGWIESPFDEALERWKHFVAGDPLHDPTLWTLVTLPTGDAGVILGGMSDTYPDTGWVNQLAVAPDFRRMGLGHALLLHIFGEFWKRGIKSVALGVDGSSLTNAVALYERAGMHIHERFDIYELELRPGIEMTKQ